ncbi:segregation/condensation protein A [bacterium]|nr:segregation/condensation protein A [bacterium]
MSEAINYDNFMGSGTMGIVPNENHVDELDGIEILVSMAKTGKINPWNIDIVDITDKYLAQMFKMKAQNLRVTSKTLLFAAVLLRLKSNILANVDINYFDEPEPEYSDDEFQADYHDEQDFNRNNVVSIDEVLQRRTSLRLNRNRVVTLKDLIRHLEFYQKLDEQQTLKQRHERAKRRVRSYANLTPDEIVNIAHDEYIKDGVQRLKENLAQIFLKEKKIGLKELACLGMDKISAYVSLLFLTVESNYELKQDEFYSDLYVVQGAAV